MTDLCLSKYENYFLLHIIKNNEIWADYLIDQLNNSSISSKEYTGAGVYIDFEIDEKNTFLKKADVPLFFEADAIAPDRSDAVFFLLYTKESTDKKSRIIHFLEIAIAGANYDEKEVYSWLVTNHGEYKT
ncbi:hypothetical protein [Neisseria dumasiana]|uniref:Uncharacterized protein n=1 Tax=Neisseria dumasiana TaxID=1931275 RepID=A0A1X3DK79_9NEIS|nr:hypothetical protein [Neisseria dumasiana]OSI23878.1 hypothetical protein BV912_03185 [Neisseria dumasiana]